MDTEEWRVMECWPNREPRLAGTSYDPIEAVDMAQALRQAVPRSVGVEVHHWAFTAVVYVPERKADFDTRVLGGKPIGP